MVTTKLYALREGRYRVPNGVLANLRTGLDLRTNTSTHFTWSSPRFISVVLISGLHDICENSTRQSIAGAKMFLITRDCMGHYMHFTAI